MSTWDRFVTWLLAPMQRAWDATLTETERAALYGDNTPSSEKR